MRLRLSRELIANVSRRWAEQYPKGRDGINEKLDALDPATATADQVAAIIGNKSWSHFTCRECSQYHERVVDLFGEYDGDRDCFFCPSCLRAAAALASVVLP